MFPIGKAAGGNQFQMPQYALTPPSGGNADVAGIQQAMERFKKMGTDMTESKLRNLASKHAAQDNSVDSRSATGEGKGLTYKTNDDDHATGTAAWDSLSQYMKTAGDDEKEAWVGQALSATALRHTPKEASMNIKAACDATGLTPYQLTFAVRVHEANLSPQQIEEGIEKAAEYMGEEYVEELREGMAKIASMDKEAWVGPAISAAARVGSRVLPWARTALGWGAKGGKAAVQGGKAAVQGGKAAVQGGKAAVQGGGLIKPVNTLKGMAQGVSKVPDSAKSMGWRMAGGALAGNQMAADDAPWYVRAPLTLGGAAFGRAMPHLGALGKAQGTRAMWGGLGGGGIDQVAGVLGHDTGGRFGQVGALGGFASPLVKGFAPGARGSKFIASGAPAGSMAATNLKRTVVGAPIAATGIGAGNEIVDSKVEAARQQSMQEVMNDPKIQKALQMAEQGGGFMDSLSGMANVIDPILKLIGIDPSQMNPMMKVLLMAGGGLGIGGLLSGSKGAGIGGLGMMAVPLIAQYMKQQQGGGAPSAPSGLDQAVGQEDARFTAQERASFDSLPQRHQDAFNAMSPEEQASALEKYRGEQTELEKATG